MLTPKTCVKRMLEEKREIERREMTIREAISILFVKAKKIEMKKKKWAAIEEKGGRNEEGVRNLIPMIEEALLWSYSICVKISKALKALRRNESY